MKRDVVVPVIAGFVFLIGIGESDDVCRRALYEQGIRLETCPSGRVRQTVEVQVTDLRRGAEGNVYVRAMGHYTTDDTDNLTHASIPVDAAKLTLVDAAGKATPVKPRSWTTEYGSTHGRLKLPEVADGDYKLRVDYTTALGKGTVDVELPLYTPARVHVITDRPLYEPGNVVKFRAVVLRAKDLSPIDGRPGTWVVKDPSGETMLEEKAPAADWGVIAGSFPLDKGAPTGSWSVAWVSADAQETQPFTVEPFTLPRFRIDAQPSKPYYLAGDTPAIRGAVVYSSGAPVPKAALDIEWNVVGAWPPPLDWQQTKLPTKLQTAANGRFELVLPTIPADLQGRVTLVANIGAVDPAGDRVATSIPVLLSQHGIEVSSVTELGDGLVQGFNNRMYVRVTTPDGRVVANTKVNIKRGWQADDAGIDAELDEDGVASVQVDPGAPVNVVIPAAPYRPAPRPPLVSRGEADELIGGEGASLADQLAMDGWLPALETCAKWVGEAGAASDDTSDASGGVTVGFRVNASGAILTAGGEPSPLGRCVTNVVRGKRLPAGAERMYAVTFNFGDPDLPSLSASTENTLEVPPGFDEKIGELAASTRDCLPKTAEGSLPLALTWSVRAGSTEVELGGWVNDPQGAPNAAMACVQSRINGRIKLEEKAESDSLGIVRFAVVLPARMEQERPQPTVMLGYELRVTADIEGKPSTILRVQPGSIPQLRLRVSPILAKAGDTITAELIRGPDFSGTLPKELELKHLKLDKPLKGTLDDERKTSFVLDPKAEGWIEITGAGQRALVYVKPQGELTVNVAPGKPTYKPGEMAQLAIQTNVGGKGGKAAVGLFGVDESLAQLVPLPGPDAMSKLRPQVTTSTPAFGTLDGQALALGRIRGANAAAATVLRVASIPAPPELDAVVSASGQTRFDPNEELTDHFYVVLAELHDQVRTWESKAPKAEKMRPRTMASLWNKALAAVEKRGKRVDDAFGRRLRLRILPQDLLALVDPRSVIVVGTRLPEDVENWMAWVRKEKP